MRLCFAIIATCCAHAAGLVSVQRQETNLTSGASLPVAWLHIPKTGSSFGNVLLHTPRLCPGVPKDFAIDSDHCPKANWPQAGHIAVLPCPQKNNISTESDCPGLSKWGGHEAVGTLFQQMYRGRGMTFLREPHQRLLSHYEFFLKPWGVKLQHVIPTLSGCSVKMMMRSGDRFDVTCAAGPPPTDEETEEAIARLDQFAFVGLSEEWDKSVCLFRKMFGGACVGADFINTRPTTKTRALLDQMEGEYFFKGYDTTALHGFVDTHDVKLYEAGKRKFNALCQQYGVNAQSCQPCYKNKDVAYTPDQR